MSESKSYGDYFSGLYAAMFKDIVTYCPSLHTDSERDYKRLLLGVESHGIGFLLDNLVSFAKHFDKCLDEGRLTLSGLHHFGAFRKGSPIPKLFKGLVLRVFHINGELRSDLNVAFVRFIRQLCMMTKSFRISCPKSRIYENVQEFFQTDNDVRLPSTNWDGDIRDSGLLDRICFADLRVPESPESDTEALIVSDIPRDILSIEVKALQSLQLVADIVASELTRFNPLEWKTKHGPGAVSDRPKGQLVFDKYSFPAWPDRLEQVFPYADFAFSSYFTWAEHVQNESPNPHFGEEQASKLIVVPKTFRAPRLIASEPTANQWCQQSILDFLVFNLRNTSISSSIDFRRQDKSRTRALKASLSRSHATIDLSSASDRISCWVVERLFRRNPSLLSAMKSSRTGYITQDLDGKQPSFHKLRKFSTMGSACTFPVQTILFTVVSVTSVLLVRGLRPNFHNIRKVSKEVQVFGDDIIVPTDSWLVCSALLTTLGLKVNTSKSFGTGEFREACGMDAFRGHDVSKVNVLRMPEQTKPETIASAVDTHNLFFSRGYEHVSNYIRSTVDRFRRYTIPNIAHGSGQFGWLTYDTGLNLHLKDRWNPFLCRREVQVTALKKDRRLIQRTDNSNYLQYFTEAAGQPGIIQGDRIGVHARVGTLKLRRTWVDSSLLG